MKYDLLKQLKTYFPEYYKSKSFDYEVRLVDLEKIYQIVDDIIYSGKLKKHSLKINIQEYDGKNSKGRFYLGKNDDNYEVMITIVKHSTTKDNFAQIVSVLCHELIHMYDFYYGKLKTYAINSTNGKPFLDVKEVGNKQFVNGYDVHGDFFKKQIIVFAKYGLIVKEKYLPSEKILMKKIKESNKQHIDMFFNKKMIESLEETDQLSKSKIQTLYDGINGCNDKDFKFFDDNHWYIGFD